MVSVLDMNELCVLKHECKLQNSKVYLFFEMFAYPIGGIDLKLWQECFAQT